MRGYAFPGTRGVHALFATDLISLLSLTNAKCALKTPTRLILTFTCVRESSYSRGSVLFWYPVCMHYSATSLIGLVSLTNATCALEAPSLNIQQFSLLCMRDFH